MTEFERFLPARHEKPATPEARKQLFQEYLQMEQGAQAPLTGSQ